MRTCVVSFESVSPYSQGKHIEKDPTSKESHHEVELHTWRQRLHTNGDGNVIVTPMAFKNCLSEAAKFLALKIPGKGNNLYTKHFEAGVLVTEPLVLDVKAADVEGEWLFVPSDGKRGGGSRVSKCFPKIEKWSGDVTFLVLDETITESIFEHVLTEAGKFIGIGRFRPRNNGYYGRFKINSFNWVQAALAA